MYSRDNSVLTNLEAEELILHNQSFPHSYLVHTPKHKVFVQEILHNNPKSKAMPSTERQHLEMLNDLAKQKFDFSKTPEEKEEVKVMKARCKANPTNS